MVVSKGSGCGSIGRVTVSNTTDLDFESSHWRYFIVNINLLLTVEKMKIKKKRPGMARF